MERLGRRDFVDGMRALGLGTGDCLHIQSNLGSLAPLADKPSHVVLEGLRELVGPEGTIVAPAFSKLTPIWSTATRFSVDDPPTTGALPRLMLRHPDAVRSTHPTHSLVAIGPLAHEICAPHQVDTGAFEPLRTVMRHGGKMVLLGCADDTPGFASVHLAQQDLGLSSRHWFRYLLKVVDPTTGKVRLMPESPGCSRGFGKAYDAYRRAGVLRTGRVGRAEVLVADVKGAYDSDIDVLRDDPLAYRCDDTSCLSCALRGYNKRAIPAAAAVTASEFVRARIESARSPE